MTENEARNYLENGLNVSRETMRRLERFVDLLIRENDLQNLVGNATLASVWSRHIVDSAQLLRFAPATAGRWLDLGTGAGLPGLIVALLFPGHVTLVEVRKLRADFLARAADLIGVAGRTRIICSRIERVDAAKFHVISARAFAPLDRLLGLGERFSTAKTRWILPKGRNANSELDAAESVWQGDFRLEPSLTDGRARIIVAEQVRRRAEGKR